MPRACKRRLRPSALFVLLAAMATPAAAQQLPRVSIERAETTPIVEELALTGSLTAPQTALLAPEVDGRLTGLAVDAGDRVEAGARLAALDAELARLELAAAEAAVREAEAELDDARRRLAEARDLAQRQSVAASEVRARETEVQRDRATLERLRAARDRQRAIVERHTLEAPFAGVISRRMGDLGEWVGPATPILELVRVDHLRLDLRAPQTYFGRVSPDTGVRVRLDAIPDTMFEARITTIVPVSDPDARTFLVRLDLANPEGRLTPGMSGRATLQLDTGREGVTIPKDGLLRYPDGRTVVWIVEGDGDRRTVHEQRVRTGLQFDGRVAIREGLAAGTAIVTEGNEALRDGQQVRIVGGR
ncbi:MAG: efflux RND transporter periplasmic adaptor subunit [Halofilum sp. (in: g-proteobacteria)]|nr:efflux RND transporter periplasmic adaptor subunit [Halofilum sp. (in: g-proteobacteria)]